MRFRLVPKSVTLNDLEFVMAVTLRYFTEFGKPALQKTICGRIYAIVYCIFSACTMSSQRKFTFTISSPDEFLVRNWPHKYAEFGRITQNNGHYAVQGNSRSQTLVPIESPCDFLLVN